MYVYIYIYAGMHLPPAKGMACNLWVYLLRKNKGKYVDVGFLDV